MLVLVSLANMHVSAVAHDRTFAPLVFYFKGKAGLDHRLLKILNCESGK